jgi:hypothetical protein
MNSVLLKALASLKLYAAVLKPVNKYNQKKLKSIIPIIL